MNICLRAWDIKFKKMVGGSDNVRDLFSIRSDGKPSNENYIIMLFVGVEDKNGRKIFEGDKVRIWHEELFFKGNVEGEIEWDNNNAQFIIMFPDEGTSIPIASIDLSFSEIEVIGHIYET